MTFTEIRNTVISRMTAQTIIDGKDVLYPNAPTFDPSGKLIWARLSNIPGQAGVNEIGAGPIVYRTGIIIIQLFVPAGSGSKLITETADKLRELFEFQDDDCLSYQAVSSIAVGEKNGWFQLIFKFHIARSSAINDIGGSCEFRCKGYLGIYPGDGCRHYASKW